MQFCQQSPKFQKNCPIDHWDFLNMLYRHSLARFFSVRLFRRALKVCCGIVKLNWPPCFDKYLWNQKPNHKNSNCKVIYCSRRNIIFTFYLESISKKALTDKNRFFQCYFASNWVLHYRDYTMTKHGELRSTSMVKHVHLLKIAFYILCVRVYVVLNRRTCLKNDVIRDTLRLSRCNHGDAVLNFDPK